uniref:FGENESH: predicted gene_10.125 protein n=1 Tax=Rhodotorula toruloides TaxID=5286 RepID=A0A0K3CL60_RHOTO
MAGPRRITDKNEFLPDWLRDLTPNGSTRRSLAGKPYYRTWRKAVLSVFDNDEYWGTRVEISLPLPPHVNAELHAICERIMADKERVCGATDGETSADSYYSKMMMALIVDKWGSSDPKSVKAAEAFGEIYGNKLLALTWKVDLTAALKRMRDVFAGADADQARLLEKWAEDTFRAIFSVIVSGTAARQEVFARCDHALHHLVEFEKHEWPMADGLHRPTFKELFAFLPRVSTLLGHYPLVKDGANQGCSTCNEEHARHAGQQVCPTSHA